MRGLKGRAAVRRGTAWAWIRDTRSGTENQHTLLVKIVARDIIPSVGFLLVFHLKVRWIILSANKLYLYSHWVMICNLCLHLETTWCYVFFLVKLRLVLDKLDHFKECNSVAFSSCSKCTTIPSIKFQNLVITFRPERCPQEALTTRSLSSPWQLTQVFSASMDFTVLESSQNRSQATADLVCRDS